MTPRLLAVLTVIAAVACAASEQPIFNGREANNYRFRSLEEGIEAYADTANRLPDSLPAICPTMHHGDCPWLRDFLFDDAWGRPFQYARIDGEYELRSLGPDGRPATSDDIVYRPSAERALVARASGCYEVDLHWWPQFPGTEFRLDTTRLRSGSYTALPDTIPAHFASWSVIGVDSIAVQWARIHEAQQLRFHVSEDSLTGYSGVGTGMASWRGAEQQRHDVIARRKPCQ